MLIGLQPGSCNFTFLFRSEEEGVRVRENHAFCSKHGLSVWPESRCFTHFIQELPFPKSVNSSKKGCVEKHPFGGGNRTKQQTKRRSRNARAVGLVRSPQLLTTKVVCKAGFASCSSKSAAFQHENRRQAPWQPGWKRQFFSK